MGLFDRFRRDKWVCVRCGETHKKNPTECKACGYTVLQQHRSSSARSSASRSGATGRASAWRCTKCGHVHDRKPFVCDECGASTLRPAAGKDTTPTGLDIPAPAPPDHEHLDAICRNCGHPEPASRSECTNCGAEDLRPLGSNASVDEKRAYWRCEDCGYLHGYKMRPEVCAGCGATGSDALYEYDRMDGIPHVECQACGNRQYDRTTTCEYCGSPDVESIATDRSVGRLIAILVLLVVAAVSMSVLLGAL